MAINSQFVSLTDEHAPIRRINFDASWKNGTGYLNHAVTQDLGLRPGDMRRGIDDHKRRFLIIGTRFGNVVIFERYCQIPGRPDVPIVFNMPHEVETMFTAGRTLDESIFQILTGGGPLTGKNVGQKIEDLFDIFNTSK